MTRLPLTVIGGYLGAGKTTLINHLLAEPHGKRLMVMVNDFGAVNIDAALLADVTEDTISLTNGCVCCTMGADLFMAVGDVLDRENRPDHLIIEASGIADPAKIAQVAQTEPDLSYAGIVTVVDGDNIAGLLADEQISAQIADQIRVADVLYVSKSDVQQTDLQNALHALNPAQLVADPTLIGPLIWGQEQTIPDVKIGHAQFVKWSYDGNAIFERDALRSALNTRPEGLYRVKGFVQGPENVWLVQVVGRSVEITAAPSPQTATLVGIGLSSPAISGQIDAWWQSVLLK